MADNYEFDEIHKLLSEGNLDLALHRIYDPADDTIKARFDNDLNHAWYIVGDIHSKKGEYEKALTAFKKSLDDRPDDMEARWALGDVYSSLGQYSDAEIHFSKALEINPDSKEMKYNLANALYDQGKYKDAIKFYKDIPNDEPSIGNKAMKNLGLAKSKLKRK